MTTSKGIVQIGAHPINEHESFSEALDCLSHALEKVMFKENEGIEWQIFADILMNAFSIGEKLENKYFGGDFSVMKKKLKSVRKEK